MNLDLSGNQLFGVIPECLTTFGKLQLLNLFNNSLTGPLPPFGLESLAELDVRYNQLTGTLDAMFDATSSLSVAGEPNATALSILRLDRNEFTGEIPTLQGAAKLTKLTLSGTELAGEVPFCDKTEYPLLDTVEVDCSEVNCSCCSTCEVVWCFTGDC